MAEEIQGILQKMATQSNIAITALCEASEDIRKSILALVRDSITNGIPDKEKVVEWIRFKREEDLQANSYSVLANKLSKGGIPTLSGRDTWSRNTVRNMLARSAAVQD